MMGPPATMDSPRSTAEPGTTCLVAMSRVGEQGAGRRRSSTKPMVWSSSQASKVGVPSMLGVMSVGLAALGRGGDELDVAAGGALVGHEAADEGDVFAVGGEAGDGDLEAVEGGLVVVLGSRMTACGIAGLGRWAAA